MMHWTDHLIMLPIVLPLLAGALMVPLTEGRHQLKFALGYGSVLGLLASALALLLQADRAGGAVYFAANWVAPFGITLLADRLAALLLVLAALLALAALHYAQVRWSRISVHFHALFQFLLMGINGAFLTHDLFNLFVFFEVMLAASYGLVLHGYNAARLRASLHYIAVNLAAALLFLVGIALIYAATGTLNMADIASRAGALTGTHLDLLQSGAAVLALAFLVKSAMWPLGFWLPTAYAAASPPVTVMLVLMTKIGVYALVRLWLLIFPDGAGAGEAARFGYDALLVGGLATMVFGAAGILATDTAGRMAGYAATVSSGTLLAALGYGEAAVVSAALYYYMASTIAIATFVLLIELVERIRTPGAAMLALTMEMYAVEDTPDEPKGRGVPAALAFLSLAFLACALMIAGLPPLSGFVGKLGLFHALLHPQAGAIGAAGWTFMALILGSSLLAIVSLMRFGVRTFWAAEAPTPPRLHMGEVLPVTLLLAASLLLTLQAQPLFDYLERAGAELQRPAGYAARVLDQAPVPGPTTEDAP